MTPFTTLSLSLLFIPMLLMRSSIPDIPFVLGELFVGRLRENPNHKLRRVLGGQEPLFFHHLQQTWIGLLRCNARLLYEVKRINFK